MRKIPDQFDTKGRQIISTMASIKAWEEAEKKAEWDESGHCLICGDNLGIVRTKWGPIKCVCALEEEKVIYASEREIYGTRYKVTDGKFKVTGNEESRKSLSLLISAIAKWTEWPDHWLTISGGVGTGKTTSLIEIAEVFKPWALYVTATDFDARLSSYMENSNGVEGSIQQFLNVMKGFPILLYDDLGSEYVPLYKDWVRSNLRKVIDYRYLRSSEFPTIVTTNMSESQIMNYDMRIGSRIMDNQIGNFINLNGVQDYRRQDANSNL
jgi:DNA replication protein DnaC